MCVVSFIGGHYEDEFKKKPYKPWEAAPSIPNWPQAVYPKIEQYQTIVDNQELKKQVEELRKQIEEMKQFLKEAIEYDKLYKQPNCENELKIAFLKKVAESVGMTLEDIFPTKPIPPPSRIVKENKIPKKPRE